MNRTANSPNWMCLFLLLLVTIRVGVIPMIYLDYELRRDYIIRNICVNRGSPQLHCDGKCYLAKKLAESQKQEQKAAESGYLAGLIYMVMETNQRFHTFGPTFYKDINQAISFKYISGHLPDKIAGSVFKPPILHSAVFLNSYAV